MASPKLRGTAFLATLLASTIVLGGLAFLATAPTAAAQSGTSISIQDFAFDPNSVTLVVGSTVTWTNLDSTTHTVTSNSVPSGAQPFNSGDLNQGATFSVTFTITGMYSYHCTIHSFMKGTVIVVAAGSSTTTASSTTTSSTTPTSTSSSTTTSTATSTATSTTRSSTSSATTFVGTSTTTTPATSTVTTTTAVSSSTTSTTSSSGGGGIPEFPFQGVLVTAVTLAVLASYLIVRQARKGSPIPTPVR